MMRDLDETTDTLVKTNRHFGRYFFVLWGLVDNLLSGVVWFSVLLYMFFRLLDGSVLVGAFAAAVSTIFRVRWLMADLVEQITKFNGHSLFLEKYYGFLAYKPSVQSGQNQLPPFRSLTFDAVSFSYDFSDKPVYGWHKTDYVPPESQKGDALKNVSLSLKKGEKIAIVGYNGAGKTTLIKLLMRLYDPTSGKILLNGQDLKDYDLSAWQDRIGVVFQDFKIFAASLAENVVNGRYEEVLDKERVMTALDAAGFSQKLSELPRELDTPLTREFDDNGVELSGGESQKVAIARVFARPYELIVMDEPSSALDPVAEYDLNQAILRYAAHKTVIFISHRLSTTRMADRIYMFDRGSLIESGNHDELMAQNGKYAEMFRMQAEKYQNVSKEPSVS